MIQLTEPVRTQRRFLLAGHVDRDELSIATLWCNGWKPSKRAPAAIEPAPVPGADRAGLRFGGWVRLDCLGRITLRLPATQPCGARLPDDEAALLTTMLIEELDADRHQVSHELGPADRAFVDRFLDQGWLLQDRLVACSDSRAAALAPTAEFAIRVMGAAPRQLLIQVAARRWQVDEAELRTGAGLVWHDAGASRASYADLSSAVASQRLPSKLPSRFAGWHGPRTSAMAPRALSAVKPRAGTMSGSARRQAWLPLPWPLGHQQGQT